MEKLHRIIDWLVARIKEGLLWINDILLDIQDSLCSFFVRFGEMHLGKYLTEATIYCLSHGFAVLLTWLLAIQLIIWSWKGLGHIIQRISELVFVRGGEGFSWMFKMFFVRVFSSIGYIFSSISQGIRKLFFGSSGVK